MFKLGLPKCVRTEFDTRTLDDGLSGFLTATDKRCNGPGNAVSLEDLRYDLCYGNGAERCGRGRLPDRSVTSSERQCKIPDSDGIR